MTTKPTYDAALGRFEADLLSPIVPGELEQWFHNLSDSANCVRDERWAYLDSLHDEEPAAVSEIDGEILRRIDQIDEGDARCGTELDALIARIAELGGLAPKCEPDELKMRNAVESLVQQGAAWVIEAKRQEFSRDTWLAEAFTRDRGGGD